jgi:hypothetical protein
MAQGNKPENPIVLLRCPEYNNPQALLEHGMAGMVRVSKSGDPAVALKAGQWLVEYAESLRSGKRPAKEEDLSTASLGGSPPWRVC